MLYEIILLGFPKGTILGNIYLSAMLEEPRILYVDDEENNLMSMKATYRRDFEIVTASSADEAVKILEEDEQGFSILLTDQRMPDKTGIDFLMEVKDKYPDSTRVLITGYTDVEAVIGAINKGEVYRYIEKPWDVNELKVTFINAHELYTYKVENKILTEKLKKVNKQMEFLLRQNLIS